MTSSYEIATPADRGWVPDACTLPTVDQPVRVAEFDALFADSVRAVERIDRTTVQVVLRAVDEDRARELAARESDCCSFFGFEFAAGQDGAVAMQVSVPAAQSAVLDAWAARAVELARSTGR